MRSTTYSQRLDKNDKRPDLTVQTSQGLDNDMVIVTVGPIGGPFQTVYLSPAQARAQGAAMIEMADEVEPRQQTCPTCGHVADHNGWFCGNGSFHTLDKEVQS
jgi:ribosomal protein S27AE